MDRRRLGNACALGAALLSLASCAALNPPLNPPGTPDPTPPGFVSVQVKVEPRVGPSQPLQGAIDLTSGSVTRQISRASRIRLVAKVGDTESGITSLTLVTVPANDGQGVLKSHNLSFNCPSSGPPLVGILDPRTDPRIDFVGGARGTAALEELVRSGGAAVAFSLHPVSVSDLMAICDAGGIMPPKSTWFEPTLRDGLLSHVI